MTLKPDASQIKHNFGLIATSYDRANDVMTAGLLRKWRARLVQLSDIRPGYNVLDTATGTGDLAFLFESRVGPAGHVVGLDFCPEMLAVAQTKAIRRQSRVDWVSGDVMALPYADRLFHLATISYGIRNVAEPGRALSELARVVRPGGKVMILETGMPEPGLWKTIYTAYFERLLPRIGGAVSGHQGPYRFLQRSTLMFPSGAGFLDWMAQTNQFQDLAFEPLWGGISYLYHGVVA